MIYSYNKTNEKRVCHTGYTDCLLAGSGCSILIPLASRSGWNILIPLASSYYNSILLLLHLEEGGIKFLRNTGSCLASYMAFHPIVLHLEASLNFRHVYATIHR